MKKEHYESRSANNEHNQKTVADTVVQMGTDEVIACLIQYVEKSNTENEKYLKKLAKDLKKTLKHYRRRY